MKWTWARIKMGALAAMPLMVLGMILDYIFGIAIDNGHLFVENKLLNLTLNCFVVLVALCLIGWALDKPVLRRLFDSLLARLPIISWLHKFIPSSEQLEKFKSGSYLEVKVEICPGIFFRGVLIKEWEEDNQLWCRILVPTTPVPITGNLIEVEKYKVKITGRKAEDLFRTYLSLGMK